jgi:MerR family transcriptional regulator, light-induced transcriptional regulator
VDTLIHGEEVMITAPSDPTSLSISEFTYRTGVPPATLRTWEARYGFPQPLRRPGGHRRYDEAAVASVEDVLRHRASGLSMEAAIQRAVHAGSTDVGSVFADIRRRYPNLVPQLLSKPLMLAISRAIEDECCAQATEPILFASFQRERFYRASQARWAELGRTARSAVVFADFLKPAGRDAVPLEIAAPANAPLHREWMIVCDARDYPACLAGWERPGQQQATGSQRRFEALWTVDPQAVRDAARTCARLAHAYRDDAQDQSWPELDEPAPPPSSDLRRASSLMNRMLGYLEAAR